MMELTRDSTELLVTNELGVCTQRGGSEVAHGSQTGLGQSLRRRCTESPDMGIKARWARPAHPGDWVAKLVPYRIESVILGGAHCPDRGSRKLDSSQGRDAEREEEQHGCATTVWPAHEVLGIDTSGRGRTGAQDRRCDHRGDIREPALRGL